MRKTFLTVLVMFLVCFMVQPVYAEPSSKAKANHADRNKDGKVDSTEMKMEKKWEKKHKAGTKGKKAIVDTPLEAKNDDNKDGVINAAESSDVMKGLKN